MENQAPPPELLIEVWEGLITNKFQGGLGAGGLGTILFKNTNPMKLMVWESSNFSSFIRNEYTYSPKLLGVKYALRQPKQKISELPCREKQFTTGPKQPYLFLLDMPRMQGSDQAISQDCADSKQP